MIAGIFSLYDIEMHALIDPSSTHSYVCIEHMFDKITLVERSLYDMHVTSPLGQSVSVNVNSVTPQPGTRWGVKRGCHTS